MALTIKQVKQLLDACPEQLAFADMSGSIDGLYDVGGPIDDPENSPRFQKIAMPAEHEDGSDPRWKLLEHAPSLARLCLSLDTQLRQEREARAELERVAEEARGVFELAGPFPSHHIETMSENWGIRPSVGGNIRLRDLGEALDALARPALDAELPGS